MAVLKYKDAQGNFVALANYTVQPIEAVQTTGSSTTEIMSQNAVTTSLNAKANASDVYTKSETNTTFLSKSDASNTYATKTDVTNSLNSLIDSAPTALDTLNELAAALGDDPNFAATITTQLGTKANADDVYTKSATDSLLNGKAASNHTHAFSQVTNKPTTLSGYGITDANGAQIKLSSSYVSVTGLPSVGENQALTASSTGNTIDTVINRIETNIKLVATEVNENETVTTKSLLDLNGKLSTHTNNDGIHVTLANKVNWNAIYSFYEGVNKVTSVGSIPTSKRLCIATISANGTFSLSSTPSAGREIHIIIKNSASSNITVTLPTSSSYVNMSGDSITVNANGYAELNVISDGTTMYIRGL